MLAPPQIRVPFFSFIFGIGSYAWIAEPLGSFPLLLKTELTFRHHSGHELYVSYMGTFHVHNKWHLHLFNNNFFGSESLPCASHRLFAFPETCGRVPDTVDSYFFGYRAHGQKCTVCPAFPSPK